MKLQRKHDTHPKDWYDVRDDVDLPIRALFAHLQLQEGDVLEVHYGHGIADGTTSWRLAPKLKIQASVTRAFNSEWRTTVIGEALSDEWNKQRALAHRLLTENAELEDVTIKGVRYRLPPQ